MNDVIKHMFTEIDNQTYDLSKILTTLSVITALGLSIYSIIWKGDTFNINEFGMGLAALFAGTAALLKFKKDSKDPIE